MENLSSIEEGKEREGQREDERKEGGTDQKKKRMRKNILLVLDFLLQFVP